MYITGIGNSKNIFYRIMKDSCSDIELVSYNEFINRRCSGIVFYDGLMLKEAENILKNCNSALIVFLTPKVIYTFGNVMKNLQKDTIDNFVCGECSLKRLKEKLFTLKLFDSLVDRLDYLTVENSFLDEYVHFSMILKKIIGVEKVNTIYTYDLHSSLCKSYEITGLTMCPNCDNNEYSQDKMYRELSFLLEGDEYNDL